MSRICCSGQNVVLFSECVSGLLEYFSLQSAVCIYAVRPPVLWWGRGSVFFHSLFMRSLIRERYAFGSGFVKLFTQPVSGDKLLTYSNDKTETTAISMILTTMVQPMLVMTAEIYLINLVHTRVKGKKFRSRLIWRILQVKRQINKENIPPRTCYPE